MSLTSSDFEKFHQLLTMQEFTYIFSPIARFAGDWIHDVAVDTPTTEEFHRRMARPNRPHYSYDDKEPTSHPAGFTLSERN